MTIIIKKKILIPVLIFVCSICLTACGKDWTPATAEDFSYQMEENGYNIVDATDQFEEGEVESVTIAVGEDYQMEFYILPSAEQASSAFAQNKEAFEDAKGNTSVSKSVSVGNHGYCYQTTNGQFYFAAVINNTMLYCVAPKDYADEIKEYAERLGYLNQ